MEARPTWIFAAPRIWERLMAAITAEAGDDEPAALRERFGLDRLAHAITGAAPCPEHVLEFFRALGVPIAELWGMTERGSAPSPGRARTTSERSAVPRPGSSCASRPTASSWFAARPLTPGYLNRPDATAELFDADGWLRTGDLATIDDEGRVRIVDRKKEMIISSAGHNMSPANIEAKLKASSPLIAQACCFGDGRDFNVAVIVARGGGRQALRERAAARRQARSRSCRASLRCWRRWRPASRERTSSSTRASESCVTSCVPDEWAPGAELTPTMKLRRRSIGARYGDLIERLYSD